MAEKLKPGQKFPTPSPGQPSLPLPTLCINNQPTWLTLSSSN